MKIAQAEKVNADIEVDEEIGHTQLSWRLQKVAWVSLFIIIALVVIGLFGDGHLSLQSVTSQHFNVQYDEYYRYQTEKSVRITSKTQTIKTVTIAQSLMNSFKVTQITPVPTRSYIVGDSRVFEFYADRNFAVAFYLTPMEPGMVEGKLKVNNVIFNLKHFIYP
jgi:hypothetical protein